ncbi:MAG: DUF1634 domain-containing protein [Acidobacteria bacterium]|nr:DUF1634 domain-containing protein [Acidobacteriota bacterium]
MDDKFEWRAELLISSLLRIGVATSAALAVIGMLLVFRQDSLVHSTHTELLTLTNASAAYPHSLGAVFRSALHGEGEGIAMLGLLLLIATPVARVMVSVGIFLRERDPRFVAITATVLLLLIVSFFLGAAGG